MVFPRLQACRDGGNIIGSEAEKRVRFDAKNRRGEWSFAASAFEFLPAAIEISKEEAVFQQTYGDVCWMNKIKTAGRFVPKFSIFEGFLDKNFLVYAYRRIFFVTHFLIGVTFVMIDKDINILDSQDKRIN